MTITTLVLKSSTVDNTEALRREWEEKKKNEVYEDWGVSTPNRRK